MLLVECRTLEGKPERSACTCRTCNEQLHSHDCHQNVTAEIIALLKHTLVHITATVSEVSVYSLAATSPAMEVRVGPRAVSVFVSVAEEEECSWCSSQCPRVVSVFVVAIVRRTGS